MGHKVFIFFFFIISFSADAAKTECTRVPRFVSLKSNNITMRVGPGYNYPIVWEYHRAHLPLEVIAEFEDWRKVRDKTGDIGWIHKSMLSAKRYVLIVTDNTYLRKEEAADSAPKCRMEKNTLAQVSKCTETACYLIARNENLTFKGWTSRKNLWGLYSHEKTFK